MPCFHSTSRGTSGQARRPSRSGFTPAQTSTNGWPTTSTCAPTGERRTSSAMRLSFEPGTRWSTSTPTRRPGPGRKSPEHARRGRRRRRGTRRRRPRPQVVAPHLLDQLGVVPALDEDPAGSRATRAASAGDGHRPGRGHAAARPEPARVTGAVEHDRAALEQEARDRAGTPRRRPRRSSRVSVPRSRSTATISPQKSVMTSSTTSPSVASAGVARPRAGARQSEASTSEPYRSGVTGPR